jgi:hypothetical protein
MTTPIALEKTLSRGLNSKFFLPGKTERGREEEEEEWK